MQKKQVLAILFVLLLSPLSHLWGDGLRINGDLSGLMQPTEQPMETDQESSEALVRNYPFLAYINFNASFQENMYLQSYTLLDVTVRENQSTLLDETIFYAMVGYRNLMNMFDFQAGRQFIITGFGFSMFDGALMNFHMDKGLVKGLAVKAYGGIPVNEDFSQEKITDVIKSELLIGGAISYKWRKMNFGVDYREQQKDKETIERLAGMDYDFQVTRRFNVFFDGEVNLKTGDGEVEPQDIHLVTDWQIIPKLRWVNSLEFYKPFLYNNSFMFNLYSNVTKEHINLNLTERIQAKERFVYMIGYGLAVSAYGGGNVFITEHDIEGEPKNEFGFITGLGLSSRKFLGTTFSLDGNMEQDPEYMQADFTLKVSKILYLPIINRLGLNMAGGMALYDTGEGQQNGYFVYLEAFFEIMRALNGYLLTEYYSNPVYGYDVRLVVKVNWKYDFSFFE